MDKEQIDRMLACMTAREERLQEMSEALNNRETIIEKQRESMNLLIQKIESLTNVQQQPPGGANNDPGFSRLQPVRSPEDIRKDKLLNLYQNLQKCSDIKSYKHSMQLNVREWLRMMESRLGILATAVDLKVADIKN